MGWHDLCYRDQWNRRRPESRPPSFMRAMAADVGLFVVRHGRNIAANGSIRHRTPFLRGFESKRLVNPPLVTGGDFLFLPFFPCSRDSPGGAERQLQRHPFFRRQGHQHSGDGPGDALMGDPDGDAAGAGFLVH
jgi:hypothetical protein